MQLSDASLRSIVAQLAHLRAAYGEVLAEAELVEPTGDYFPDEFAMTNDGIQRLLDRMATYAPLSPSLAITLGVVAPDDDATSSGGSCSTGGCGPSAGGCGPGEATTSVLRPAVETDDGYVAVLAQADAGDSTVLTTSLARSLGRIVLFEAEEDLLPDEEGPMSELTAVGCGLGLLLLNGAAVYKKGCGGMKRHQATFLSVDELAFALALFLRVKGEKPSRARRHLEITQREAFDAALAWVDAQPTLLEALRTRPETLEDGVFTLEAPRGIFAKLWSRKRDDELASFEPRTAPKVERTEAERKRLAEARALVDAALEEA